jgi:hypothetical protein
MIKGLRGFAAAALTAGIGVASPPIAAPGEPPEMGAMKLGYVELADDRRYALRPRFDGEAGGNPCPATPLRGRKRQT